MPSLARHIQAIMAAAMLAASPGAVAEDCCAMRDTTATTTVRPIVSAFSLGIGSEHLCDTYLTPLHYSGWGLQLGYERLQAMRFDPERWIMQLGGTLTAGATDNPAGNMTMWEIDLDVRWAMMHRFTVAPGLKLAFGGATGITLGALYNRRNGNNPISARAAWTLDATAMAAYNTRLSRLPITLRYQATMPLVGAFFAPDYGELYYEIYLGNHSGLAHCAWPGNYFKLSNLLTADLHFGATILRLGYSATIFSSKANEIVSRRVSHLFVIGVTTEWLSLRPRSSDLPKARVISARY